MVIAYDRASVIVLKIMTIVMVIRLLDHPWMHTYHHHHHRPHQHRNGGQAGAGPPWPG